MSRRTQIEEILSPYYGALTNSAIEDITDQLLALDGEAVQLRLELDEARRERDGMQWLAQKNRAEADILLERIAALGDLVDQQRIRAEAAETELELYRQTATVGGPPPKYTVRWENGPSTRPSTAGPDVQEVALP